MLMEKFPAPRSYPGQPPPQANRLALFVHTYLVFQEIQIAAQCGKSTMSGGVWPHYTV